jgi:PhzF family phenazine biosynthesis protein
VRIFQVDAFTTSRFSGNPATVILDADGSGDATLAAIAREYAHAETAFVLAANAADHDLRVRFFNARKEAPFVGHATVAAHAVLLALGRRRFGLCRQQSGTGIIEVGAIEQDAGLSAPTPLIEFRQTVPELDEPLPLKTTLRVAEALRLAGAALHAELPARVARKGGTRLLVPAASARALDGLAPNHETLQEIGRELGVEGFFVFAAERGAAAIGTQSRMFCPALGIPEDPVSGNAHAMLAAYLFEQKLIDGDGAAFVGRQGSQVGRPGQVYVRLDVDRGRLCGVWIGGAATIVSEGRLVEDIR